MLPACSPATTKELHPWLRFFLCAKVRDHREMETRVKTLRTETRDLVKEYNKTEDDLKALQVGFIFVGTGVHRTARSITPYGTSPPVDPPLPAP